jgi:hypothetical protein
MATKTETRPAQIPDDVKPYVPEILRALRRALETGDFTIEIAYDNATIKIPDIRVHLFETFMRIMYKDFDIVYSDYVASIKVYKDPYGEPEIYYAHDYWDALYELHELAKEKVKERLHKILSKF